MDCGRGQTDARASAFWRRSGRCQNGCEPFVSGETQTGFPSVSIDDRPVQVIQVATGDELGAKLYFDKETGLLVRQVRYTETPVGVIPTQVDYSDYRDVAGVKMPFHQVVTWTDGRSTIALSEIQPNAQIDASRFAMPAPPRGKQTRAQQ